MKAGVPVTDAIRKAGGCRSTFYKWKAIAEMKIVNNDEFENLQEGERDPATLLMNCKLALLGDGNAAVVEDKRKVEDLIK